MREKTIEQYLKQQVEGHGGVCIKSNPLYCKGFPDRIVVLHGLVCFIEVKASAKSKISPLQIAWIKKLRSLGQKADILSSIIDVDNFIKSIV